MFSEINNWEYNKRCRHRRIESLAVVVKPITVQPAHMTLIYEGFYNFSKICLQFFSFFNVVFSVYFMII